MFKTLTEDLLELTAEAKGSGRTYFAETTGCCCCCCSRIRKPF